MGGVLGALLPGKEALVKAVMECDVDVEVATKIGDLFSQNDVKAVGLEVDKLLSGNSLSFENKLKLQEVVKVTLDGAMSNNTMQILTGDSLTSLGSLGALFVIVLALIFKNGVPPSLIVVLFSFIFFSVWAIAYLRQLMTNLKETKTNICAKVVSSSNDELQQIQLAKSNFQIKVASLVGARVVAEPVAQSVEKLHAIHALHTVAEVCNDISNTSLGKLSRRSSTDRFGLVASVSEAKEEIKKLTGVNDTIRTIVRRKTNQQADVARSGRQMLDEVRTMKHMFENRMKDLIDIYRPDFLLTTSEKERKARLLQAMETMIRRFYGKWKDVVTGMEVVAGAADSTQEGLDVDLLVKSCDQMQQVIAWDPESHAKEQAALKEAMEEQDKGERELIDVRVRLAKIRAKIEEIRGSLSNKHFSHNLKVQALTTKIESQKQALKGLGHGTLKLTGLPPRSPDDPICDRLYNLWRNGKWEELMTHGSYRHSRGGRVVFELEVDANLTQPQKDGAANLTRFIEELEKEKKSYALAVYDDKERLALEEVELKAVEEREKHASQKLASIKSNQEETWAQFKLQNPVQFAEIQQLWQVKHHVKTMVHWISDTGVNTSMLVHLFEELGLTLLEEVFAPKQAMMLLNELYSVLTEKEAQPLAFLVTLGEQRLKQISQPAVGGRDHAKRALEDYESVGSADKRPRLANDAPREVN